jgi:hypothetical protein
MCPAFRVLVTELAAGRRLQPGAEERRIAGLVGGEARGYVFDQAEPELLVNFNVNVEQRTEVRSSPSVGVRYGY